MLRTLKIEIDSLFKCVSILKSWSELGKVVFESDTKNNSYDNHKKTAKRSPFFCFFKLNWKYSLL